MALQEVCFRNDRVKTLGGGDFEFRLCGKGDDTASRGVKLMMKCELSKLVMDFRRISPRVLSVDLVLCGKVMTIISVYKPQIGRNAEDKNCFYDDLSAEVHSKNGNCIVQGDFNGHVGSSKNRNEGVHGKEGWAIQKRNRKRLMEFADSFDMVVGNTFFKKNLKKPITFKFGGNSSLIDYIVTKKKS